MLLMRKYISLKDSDAVRILHFTSSDTTLVYWQWRCPHLRDQFTYLHYHTCLSQAFHEYHKFQRHL